MDSANQQDDDPESKSYASFLERHNTGQPPIIGSLDTLEIDKILRSNGTCFLVCIKTYGETFLYVTSPSTENPAIFERGAFMAYNYDIGKRLCE